MSSNTAALIITLAIAPLAASGPASIIPPPVPANLEVPAGVSPFLLAHATGTQNYICIRTGNDIQWLFLGPQATLFDEAGEQVMTHYLSPNPAENGAPRATWRHSGDTSTLWAGAVASSTDPNFVEQGAIPWLLLRVLHTEYGPTMGGNVVQTTHVQRVNTSGGSAPAGGCRLPKDVGTRALVPYSTDYVFYK